MLALIIGFSISMASSRYDQRKNREEAEANAIGTEMLRADLLPPADELGKEEARRIILGSAYQYKADVLSPEVPPTKFADEHGLPAQR